MRSVNTVRFLKRKIAKGGGQNRDFCQRGGHACVSVHALGVCACMTSLTASGCANNF